MTGVEPPALLSVSAARAFFPEQDPLGKVFREDAKNSYRIVGVVDDAKYADLRQRPPLTLYLKTNGGGDSNYLVIRSQLDRTAMINDVRSRLKRSGKDIRLGSSISLTEQIDQTLVTERLIALLASFFAGLAAVLVAIGIYGVVGYTAARRTSEIGVRLALGETPAGVRWLVLRDALLLSVLGAAVGIPVAVLGGRMAESLLYGIKPGDPAVLLSTVLLILAVTAIAGLIPAIRAARMDPVRALRYE